MHEQVHLTPIVSICMITYNHAKFIAQAIESVLMQKTNFSYQLVIGEDASTDATYDICKKYSDKCPEKILLLPKLKKNIGARKNSIRTLEACKGKYIAMLEGDDYWTDPNKLQLQIDFLQNHSDYIAAFHDVTMIDEFNSKCDDNRLPIENKRDFNLNELFFYYVPTPTILFRNIFKKYPSIFTKVDNGDTVLQGYLTQKGMIKYIQDIAPSVIRIHNQSFWTSRSTLKKWNELLKTNIYSFKTYNKKIQGLVFDNRVAAFEMATFDAREFNSSRHWYLFNFQYVYFLCLANNFGKAFLILRRIANRLFNR